MSRMIDRLPPDERDGADGIEDTGADRPGVLVLRRLASGCFALLCALGEAMWYLNGPGWSLRGGGTQGRHPDDG